MDTLEIHDFNAGHLNDAGLIALQQWKNEVPGMPEKMEHRIYQYLVRYYFVPESPFSTGATENGKLCAFLLAAPASHIGSKLADQWISGQLNDRAEEAFFQEYKAYADVFGEIPLDFVMDSFRNNLEDGDEPAAVLNRCRFEAYRRDGVLLSKEAGGKWGLLHLPEEEHESIRAALQRYI